MTILEARSVAKSYSPRDQPVVALRGVDFAVEAGELVAVMGPSGCGKSTLLHLLGGLDRPSSGEIYLHGERVDGLSETAWAIRRRQEIGYVFQFFNLVGNLTAADNIELPGRIAGLSSKEVRRRRIELMEELEIAGRAQLVPARLSGGERQRVALARALINRPAILLADEPTGNLDSVAAGEVMMLLRKFHDEGQTTVLVTHDMRVASAADRVVRMRDGAVVSQTALAANRDERGRLADLATLEI